MMLFLLVRAMICVGGCMSVSYDVAQCATTLRPHVNRAGRRAGGMTLSSLR